MAKKKEMTVLEKEQYIKDCKFALDVLKGQCGPLLGSLEEIETDACLNNLEGIWLRTEYLLVQSKRTLAIIQRPDTIDEYDRQSLVEFKEIMVKLGYLRIYCNQQNLKTNNYKGKA